MSVYLISIISSAHANFRRIAIDNLIPKLYYVTYSFLTYKDDMKSLQSGFAELFLDRHALDTVIYGHNRKANERPIADQSCVTRFSEPNRFSMGDRQKPYAYYSEAISIKSSRDGVFTSTLLE